MKIASLGLLLLVPIGRRLSHSVRPESRLRKMLLDTPHFRALFDPETERLSELFRQYRHELRIAGGAVRDLLMDRRPEDIDFATTATPQEMREMFEKEGVRMLHKKGEAHGTVTVRINDLQNFEVTTLRVDVKTDGRHAEVEFTTDWELDAGRRDLTINAMFLGLDGTLYDYFNGKEDLEKRRVRFVGDPECRIREDYLRILRYFRFYGRIAQKPEDHEPKTLEAIRRNAEGLKSISGERLWMELKKILAGNYAKEIMLKMISLGIAPHIGLPAHPDVVEFACMCDRSHSMKPHPVTRLAALLRTEEEVLCCHSRLKLSKYDRDLALHVVNHRVPLPESTKPLQALILDSKHKTSDVHEWCCEVLKYCGQGALWRQLKEWQVPKFPISGHLLMERGLRPGPQMTRVMTRLKGAWVESGFTMTREELLRHLEEEES
ncbi:CCA tRNA nucleotidyltransferase 1, mitochondrial-like [Uloborus diversus]|uniref:CCA tRNA nucleotidyltransferase 1, mitochondrial-like n=1 Tax=Uloborus diversus TaxID=327109 RepID=UPI0024093AD7|nr:CCA tRNA nucleotidyltransferase 1, mitochondrial-like [Uloborus diversus]